MRLTRNLNKGRGFVNGATAIIEDSLEGNAVFTARLVGTGNLVLVHPIHEHGAIFLPCCYGYATTIRRAQGADLHHGCIFLDQKRRAAQRGYAYLACSRFKSRAGCYLYGRLRTSDFLPVDDVREDGKLDDNEIVERGYLSVSSDGDDGEGIALAYGNPLAGGMDSDDELHSSAALDADAVDFDVVLETHVDTPAASVTAMEGN